MKMNSSNVKLFNGDCMELIKDVGDNSVDAVITSPPYNFDMGYSDYDDNKKWEEYFRWLKSLWVECYRILKDDGRLIINIQPNFKEYIPSHHIITTDCLSIGFKWKGEILWEKNNYNCGYCTWGSWKSPAMPYLKYTWEFVEVFVKKDYKHIGNSEDIDITADEFKEWVTAKWSIAPENRMKEFGHPAMFPEKLPERLIKLFTYKHDLILDPFMGTGTTGAVCVDNERDFIGFELDTNYFDIATNRINERIEQAKYKKDDLFI